MKIQQLDLQNFMIFDQLNMTFSPDINIFCGENSTGKTALLKLLYTCAKTSGKLQNAKGDITKEQIESKLVSKLQGGISSEQGQCWATRPPWTERRQSECFCDV